MLIEAKTAKCQKTPSAHRAGPASGALNAVRQPGYAVAVGRAWFATSRPRRDLS